MNRRPQNNEGPWTKSNTVVAVIGVLVTIVIYVLEDAYIGKDPTQSVEAAPSIQPSDPVNQLTTAPQPGQQLPSALPSSIANTNTPHQTARPEVIQPPKAPNPPPNEVPVNPDRAFRDTLYAEGSLGVDQPLTSQNRLYRLVVQKDGNVVEYGPKGEIIWASNTLGRKASMLLNQLDGNIVLKDAAGNTLCAFGTSGREGAYLIMQDDGHLVVYAPDHGGSIWDSQGKERGQCV